MTIDQFADLTKDRIPTPTEFKAFADTMGYRIVRNGEGSAVLRVKDKTDPMARALARMLGREPWRSEVLKLAEDSSTAPAPVAPTIKPAGRPDGVFDCETYKVHRGGVCRARTDGYLCWAKYATGGWYWFEELVIQGVKSYRVFAGTDSGFAGPTKFAEMFEEEAGGR